MKVDAKPCKGCGYVPKESHRPEWKENEIDLSHHGSDGLIVREFYVQAGLTFFCERCGFRWKHEGGEA